MAKEARGNSRDRGYTTRWDKVGATFKARHPHCLGCAAIGKQSPTEVIDHVDPHKGDQKKFWNTAMWQPACRWHHDVVKRQMERMLELGQASVADMRLDSALAQRLSRKRPVPAEIGPDGWPRG